MPDIFTKQKRSRVMSQIRSWGNKETELKLISILRAYGITGWRRHQPLPGRPDFMFRRERLVIFVDGCCWPRAPSAERWSGSCAPLTKPFAFGANDFGREASALFLTNLVRERHAR
jgi:DNA mismatch endonuclease Vsr